MAGSTAGLQGASASGMRQEMRRNCTDGPVSGVRTGTRFKDVHAGQDLFRPIPAQGGYGPDCLVNRGLGVRVPPSALNTKHLRQAPDLRKRAGRPCLFRYRHWCHHPPGRHFGAQRGRRELVVCAVVAARSPDEACQAVTIRVVELAGGLIGGSLRRRSVRVQRASPWRRAGRVNGDPEEGDDGWAGDREPRHPAPAPGHLQAERRP